MFDTKLKTSLPELRLENIDFEKSVDPSQQNDTQKLILVDLVDDEEVVELLQRLTMRDLKKRKELLTLIRSIITFITLHWLRQSNIFTKYF